MTSVTALLLQPAVWAASQALLIAIWDVSDLECEAPFTSMRPAIA